MVGKKATPGSVKQESPKRKKRREVGTYACSSCPKVFTRSDHLARHYLNHQPKEVYICDYVIISHKGLARTCGKTFVRKDLRERHYKRHLIDKPEEEIHERSAPDTNENRSEPTQAAMSSSHSTPSERHAIHGPGLHFPIIPGQCEPDKGDMGVGIDKALPAQIPQAQGHMQPSDHQFAPQASPNNPAYGKPFPFQATSQPQISPLSQVYPHTYHMHPNHHQQQQQPQLFPQSSPPISMLPSHPQEPQPVMTNGPQRFPTKPYAFVPDDPNAIDPNTVNPHDIMHNYMPQPPNDIISWLFLESPESARTDQSQMGHVASTPTSVVSDFNPNGDPSPVNPALRHFRNLNFPENNLKYGLPQNHVDPMLNIGLQDLNYFSNNDNPLEEAFKASPVHQTYKQVGRASAASSSPTNTNESSTPRSQSEKSQNDLAKPSVKERLTHHFHRVNLEDNTHVFVDEIILKSWLSSFSDVSRPEMEAVFHPESTEGPFNLTNRLSYYLHGYWEVFHPKFPILHRPSFDTKTANPLLIFAMICAGAMYCTAPSDDVTDRKYSAEFDFCMLITRPLRFKLFEHSDFKSPIKVWILQTLNLLEWTEKNYLSRQMHERAHIHHGTTVQLLRRSPFLGGNPENTHKPGNTSAADSGVSGSEEDTSDAGVSMDIDTSEEMDTDASLFEKWVESESMKRITFMTFYLDITDYIKFRHNPQIPFYQLQFLNLPCDDEKLWDCDEVNGSFKKLLKKQKSLQKPNTLGSNSRSLDGIRAGMNFLTALKRIIKPARSGQSCRKLSIFTRTILFGGITSVMHQVQQAELQNNFTFLVSNARLKRNTYWKEVIVKALDHCEVQSDQVSNSVGSSDLLFSVLKGQCRFPMYHLIHIIGLSDVNHYDIAIFGGSSQNMSVKATSKDYNIVKRKLTTLWQANSKQGNDTGNFRSVIHCYWLLWGLMLKPMDTSENSPVNHTKYAWSIDQDYYDVMYPVSVSMLVLWCYTFIVCGVESSKLENTDTDFQSMDKMNLEQINGLVAEEGYEYLIRMRDEFKRHIQEEGLTSDYLLHTTKGSARQVPAYQAVTVYCDMLQKIEHKKNISGLCLLVGKELLKSQWEIVRENAKLIINCGLRSLGKTSVHCPDLFNEGT